MRVIAFSDSHGDRGRLSEAAEQALRAGPVDVCVHCGDGARDIDAIALILKEKNPNVRLYAVKGNADFCEFGVPTYEQFDVNGVRMIATHGHLFNVKSELESMLSMAEARGAKVVFFGHTHRSYLEAARGLYLINPGSVAYHLTGNVAYAQVLVDAEGKIKADLMRWIG